MKHIKDFPLIAALVTQAKTNSLPAMTATQCQALCRRAVPEHMVSQFEATETYLTALTSEAAIHVFYKSILDGAIHLPIEHESTMAYAAGSISDYLSS